MNLYRKTVGDIKEKKYRAENGGVNAIPFKLPALSQYVPGVMQEIQYGLTAESGASKSKFVRYNFVQTPYDFYVENREHLDIDVEIFIFSLEDSADTVMKNLIVSALAKQRKIRISTLILNSYFQDNILPDNILREIDSLDSYFEHFLSKVHIIDNIRNPYGIYKKVEDRLLDPTIGSFYDLHDNIIHRDQLSQEEFKLIPKKYKSKHPNKFNIVIIDNLQNIEAEKADNGSKWTACDNLCRRYMRERLCNVFKTSNVIIQQQEKSSGKAQYTNTGSSIVEKLLPSISGLAEYKNSVDSAHCFFGLFNPYKHRIEDFQTSSGCIYDITRLGDYYRNLSILKSNFAETINTSLFFDSFAEQFVELPHPADKDKIERVYDYINTLKQNTKQKLYS